jgi:hypothetical protein
LDRTEELEEQVQRLTGEVDDMRARMARLESGEPAHHNGTEPKSRRGFLKFGAGAVMGALGVAAAKVLPATAATGGNFILGNPNAAGVTTGLTGDNTVDATLGPNPTLKVQALNLSGSKLATALGSSTLHGAVQALGGDAIVGPPPIAFEGIDAFASGSTAWGVYGLTDAGTGVVGESNTGIGLYARRSGRIRQEGLALAGAPTYGPNPYEQVRDANGVLWIHNAAGNWRRVNSLRTDAADGSGNPFKPFRLADTRNGTGLVTGPVAGGSTKVFTVAPSGTGASSIPADAIAVVGNLTAVGWNVSGWLTIFPAGVTYDPNADPSSMNFSGSAYAWANSFVVGLGTGTTWGGKVAVYVGTLGGGSTNFILDITGYIQ